MDYLRYLNAFIDEANENVHALNRYLLEMEQTSGNPALLNGLFRSAHTLKASSQTMGFSRIARLTHEMENIISAVQEGRASLDSYLFDLLFRIVDCFESFLFHIFEFGNEGGSGYDELLNEIASLNIGDDANHVENDVHPANGDGASSITVAATPAAAAGTRAATSYVATTRAASAQTESAAAANTTARAATATSANHAATAAAQLTAPATRASATSATTATSATSDASASASAASAPAPAAGENGDFFAMRPDHHPMESLPSFNSTERASIQEAFDNSNRAYEIKIELARDCLMKAARAFIIIQTFEKYGEIIRSDPKIDDIEDERFGSGFSITLLTGVPAETLHSIIGGLSEIEKYVIVDIKPESLFAPAAPAATASPAGRPFSGDGNANSGGNVGSGGKTGSGGNAGKTGKTVKTSKVGNGAAKPQETISARIRPRADWQAEMQGKTVRIGLYQLDSLQVHVSELSRMVTDLIERLPKQLVKQLADPIERLEESAACLEGAIARINTAPLSDIFDRFPRIFSELTKKLEKQAEIVINGGETRCDVSLVSCLTQPLLHILRNSIDHGIEIPDARLEKGKPAEGLVTVNAYSDGEEVIIEVEDDGAGIDVGKLRAKAIKAGVLSEAEAKTISDEKALNLVFLPSLSTREQVSMYSGRGVGMDVVKAKVEEVGGSVEIASEIGAGTKITIKMPYSVSVFDALLVKIGGGAHALRLSQVERVLRLQPSMIKTISGKKTILYKDDLLPLIFLGDILGDVAVYFELFHPAPAPPEEDEHIYDNPRLSQQAAGTIREFIDGRSEGMSCVVVNISGGRAGLIVDEVEERMEIVQKPFGRFFPYAEFYSGTANAGGVFLAFILDVSAIIKASGLLDKKWEGISSSPHFSDFG